MAFVVAGSIGLLWLVPWLLIFRKPEEKVEGWSMPVFSFSYTEPEKESGVKILNSGETGFKRAGDVLRTR